MAPLGTVAFSHSRVIPSRQPNVHLDVVLPLSSADGLVTDNLVEVGKRARFLVFPEGVLEERREQPRTKQGPTQLTQWQRMQPLPVTQLQRGQPSVEHHEEDTCQRQRNGQ